MLLLVVLFVVELIEKSQGHGYLYEPPSRSTMWRWPEFKGKVLPNYNDMSLRCFGDKQTIRCGICGDPANGPQRNLAGGIYARGIISRTYHQGDVISIKVKITASHKGYFEFHICPNNNTTKPITEECLERYPLRMSDGSPWYPEGGFERMHTIPVQLPANLTCSQCVLRWQYTTDNNPGTDLIEIYKGCADIAILPRHTLS